jgi:Ni,Fe-hydrogenase III small subunit/ferredoxin
MLDILRARLHQKRRTVAFPAETPSLPDRLRGLPVWDAKRCPSDCRACAEACPTNAIRFDKELTVDLGRCLFCSDCTEACPTQTLKFTGEYRLAAQRRENLTLRGTERKVAEALNREMLRLFGRSLRLRQVSAAGCNACEADLNVLSTVVFDLGRFGIQFVAAPRHADGLLVTGPVSRNMAVALKKTWAAVPSPKLLIAVGACAISGGPFLGHAEVCPEWSQGLEINLFVPGCPPHPLTILDGLLRMLGRMPNHAKHG